MIVEDSKCLFFTLLKLYKTVCFVSDQLFSYLIVIDFESTCWREKNSYSQEISKKLCFYCVCCFFKWIIYLITHLLLLCSVEFPAVLLNTATGEIESEFHTYVQPQEHPILSKFCTELTGITQVCVQRHALEVLLASL